MKYPAHTASSGTRDRRSGSPPSVDPAHATFRLRPSAGICTSQVKEPRLPPPAGRLAHSNESPAPPGERGDPCLAPTPVGRPRPLASAPVLFSYAFVNLKPGVGKTTSAVWLAHALHESGIPPLLVDSDPASSALRWSELAGGFPFPVIALPVGDVHRRVNDFLGHRQAVVFDAPQLEDHAHIARSIMRYASEWIVPVTPAPIELDRMAPIGGEMGDMQSLRATPARAAVLLNRTNRPDATRTGPDADAREALTERGFDVLSTHIPRLDLYAQSFGSPIEVKTSAYMDLADELIKRQDKA
ncbi:ParA family protein [Streptomyces sp. NPDC005209]|uniref:ParA family protein n=1 Tax=Streptomyces sp. NPDC005209 TaxID=3156715 RepID=UPI0033A5DEFC